MTNEKIIAQLKDMQSRCTNGYDAEALNLAIKALEEQPTGEWKFCEGVTTLGYLKCSICEYVDFRKEYSDYCPNCGAKMNMKEEMKGEEE